MNIGSGRGNTRPAGAAGLNGSRLIGSDAEVVFFAGAGDNGFRRFRDTQPHFLFGTHNLTAQRVGVDVNDFDIDELTDHIRSAFEVDYPVVLGAS